MKRPAALACLLLAAGCAGDKAAPVTSAPAARQLAAFGVAPGVSAPADAAPLTKDQLHACLAESQKVHGGSPAAQGAQAGLLDRQAALKARQAELEAQKPAKNADPGTIAAYNKQARALNADFAALKRDDDANSARVGGVNVAASAFNAQCSGRSFYTDDLDAMRAEFPDFKL